MARLNPWDEVNVCVCFGPSELAARLVFPPMRILKRFFAWSNSEDSESLLVSWGPGAGREEEGAQVSPK